MSKATEKKKLKEVKQAITNEQNYPWTVNSVLTDKPGSRYSALQSAERLQGSQILRVIAHGPR